MTRRDDYTPDTPEAYVRAVRRLTRRVRVHRDRLRAAAVSPDPDVVLPGRGYDRDRGDSSRPANPVAGSVEHLDALRGRLLAAVVHPALRLTSTVAELVDGLGELDATREHLEHLAAVDPGTRPPASAVLEVDAIVGVLWDQLAELVIRYSDPTSSRPDLAPVAHRNAVAAERQLNAAGSWAVATFDGVADSSRTCADRFGRGCRQQLDQLRDGDRTTCRACHAWALRERRRLVEEAAS